MNVSMIETAKARRALAVEKKRMRDELRKLRHTRAANRSVPRAIKADPKTAA